MTRHTAPLVTLLILALSAPLGGCDPSAKLTEQEHIQRAKDFEDKGNLKGSIIELKNAILKNPDSPQARLLLGQVYLKAGFGAEAEKEFTRAEKLGVSRESIKPQLGEALLLLGEYKRVLDEIEPGEQTSRSNLARILQLRAAALFKQGKLNDACSLFHQSLDTDPQNPPTYWGLAQCAVAQHDLAKAKEWLDAALKINSRQATTWTYVGDLEQLNNHAQAALVAYTNALKSEPDNLSALERRISTSLSVGQAESARKDLDHLLKLAPKSVPASYLKALFNFQEKKYAEARENLLEVFRQDPNHLPSVLLAGMTAYVLGSYQQAETYLNQFLVSAPAYAPALRVLAATQIKQNQPNKALETLAPLLSADTKDAETLALAGEAYLRKNQATLAAEYLEKAAAADPANAGVQAKLGLSRLAAGNTQLAIAGLLAASAQEGNQYQADTLLVLTFLNHKDYDKALAAIDRMEKKLPLNPVTYHLRGKAYLGKNDQSNARRSFEQALAIDPAFFQAAANLAQLDLQDGKPDAARKRFETLLDKDNRNVSAMMALADLSAIAHDDNGYVEWLLKAVKTNPKTIKPRADLIRYYLAKKENRKAMSQANEVVNDYPDSLAALNLLAVAQMASGDKAASITTFSRITQKAPQSPEALLNLAEAQLALKQMSDARATLQRAIKLQPDFIQAQDALMRLELGENRPDAALQIARQIQMRQPTSPIGFDREADIQLLQKNYPQALKACDQALAKGAGAPGLIKIYRVYTLAGNPKAADQRLSAWIQQHPTDYAARNFAAEIYMQSNRNQEAAAQYEALLKANPNNVAAINNLATLYQRLKDNRALPLAEQALKLAPEQPLVQDTLGWILVGQGQLPRGLDLLRKAAAKAPEVASIRYHYAAALARNGNKIEAKNELNSALKSSQKFPEFDEAQVLLRSL